VLLISKEYKEPIVWAPFPFTPHPLYQIRQPLSQWECDTESLGNCLYFRSPNTKLKYFNLNWAPCLNRLLNWISEGLISFSHLVVNKMGPAVAPHCGPLQSTLN